ncbi:MAG: sulfatase-like hydrolase/transferase [Alphaproteobacteria bacterium]|nr:sulfatase-like hydrolase/transferase [Alphaproteobacteria bacterium]
MPAGSTRGGKRSAAHVGVAPLHRGLYQPMRPTPPCRPRRVRGHRSVLTTKPSMQGVMEVYSGMIEAMDHRVGRLIDHIASRGELNNTVFVITSDNGPEPSDPVHEPWMDIWMSLNGYNWNLEGMGEPGSLGFIGPE